MKAPAKINLLLRILSKREDGNHEIESLMQAVDLYDEVEIETFESGTSSEIICKTLGADLPDDKNNLAYRAAQMFLEEFDINCHAYIRITKHIPIAAGLAGGSADAAAVLLALATKYKPELSLAELSQLGVKLGADIPFQIYTCASIYNLSLYGDEAFCTAVASGIGEKLTPVKAAKKAYVLLVNPGVYISAGDAYHLFDIAGKTTENIEANSLAKALETGDESAVKESLANDLMGPVSGMYPEVKNLIGQMTSICDQQNGKVMMSGSGPTVFALFYDIKDAENACREAQVAFPGMYIHLAQTL